VRVADRGSGVPACDEGQLFTPFFTTKQEGMGIGLAICRSIVEFHGGQLYFERNTGGGSVFAFTLPQAQES
jgi:signal transduction histidine kinase